MGANGMERKGDAAAKPKKARAAAAIIAAALALTLGASAAFAAGGAASSADSSAEAGAGALATGAPAAGTESAWGGSSIVAACLAGECPMAVECQSGSICAGFCPGFVDANGDGVCDNAGEGTAASACPGAPCAVEGSGRIAADRGDGAREDVGGGYRAGRGCGNGGACMQAAGAGSRG